MKNNNNINDLENINGNKNPFSVPDGYFDSFPMKMQDKIIISQQKSKPFFQVFFELKSELKYAYVFAFILLFVVGYWFIFNNVKDNVISLNPQEIVFALDEEMYNIDEYYYIEALVEMESNNMDVESNDYDVSLDDISIDDLIEEL